MKNLLRHANAILGAVHGAMAMENLWQAEWPRFFDNALLALLWFGLWLGEAKYRRLKYRFLKNRKFFNSYHRKVKKTFKQLEGEIEALNAFITRHNEKNSARARAVPMEPVGCGERSSVRGGEPRVFPVATPGNEAAAQPGGGREH